MSTSVCQRHGAYPYEGCCLGCMNEMLLLNYPGKQDMRAAKCPLHGSFFGGYCPDCTSESRIDEPSGGGKLTGDHYYRVRVGSPISGGDVYHAECADIIESLGMTFNEGEAFKALWRLAAARQGRGKPAANPQYDADKVEHYGQRVAVQTRAQRGEDKPS